LRHFGRGNLGEIFAGDALPFCTFYFALFGKIICLNRAIALSNVRRETVDTVKQL